VPDPLPAVTDVTFLTAQEVKNKLRDSWSKYDHCEIAVAYLNVEGFRVVNQALKLTSLSTYTRKSIKLLVGLAVPFCLTHPSPLKRLLNKKEALGKRGRGSKLQIRYYGQPAFHPKLFLFRGNLSFAAVIGSSNATGGGIGKNVEANVFIRGRTDLPFGNDAIAFFNDYWKRKGSEGPKELTFRRLEDYRRYWLQHHPKGGKPVDGSFEKGRIPKRDVGLHRYLSVNGETYSSDLVLCFCVSCGSPVHISTKYLEWWNCGRKGHVYTWNSIVKTSRGVKPKADVGGKIVSIRRGSFEYPCIYKIKGKECGRWVDHYSDLTHMICQNCYRKLEAQGLPHFRIPRGRTPYSDSFFYNLSKEDVLKKS
jgi:HKD family nuclease